MSKLVWISRKPSVGMSADTAGTSARATWRRLQSAASRLIGTVLLSSVFLHAETGYDAWLRYSRLEGQALTDLYSRLPATVVALDIAPALVSAQGELIRGMRGLLGRTLRAGAAPVQEDMILLGTLTSIQSLLPTLSVRLRPIAVAASFPTASVRSCPTCVVSS